MKYLDFGISLFFGWICVLLLLASSGAAGYGLRRLLSLKLPPVTGLFIDLVVGLSVFATIFAVWETGGKSILLLLLVLSGFFAAAVRKRDAADTFTPKAEHAGNLRRTIWMSIPVSLLLYFFYSLSVVNYPSMCFSGGEFIDRVFYANLCEYLSVGRENLLFSLNLLPDSASAVYLQPYHYWELWLAALSMKFGGLPAQLAVSATVPATLGSVYCIGLCAWSENQRLSSSRILFLLPLSFFGVLQAAKIFKYGLGWTFWEDSGIYQYYMVHDAMKLFPPILLFCGGLLLMKYGYRLAGGVMLVAIAVCSTAWMPAILLAAAEIELFHLWKMRRTPWLWLKRDWPVVAAGLVVVAGFACFYFRFLQNGQIGSTVEFGGSARIWYEWLAFPVTVLLTYALPVLILLWLRRFWLPQIHLDKEIGGWIILVLSGSFLFYALTRNSYDGRQFASNVWPSLLNFLIAVAIIHFRPRRDWRQYAAMSVLVLILCGSLGQTAIRSCFKFRQEHPNPYRELKIAELKRLRKVKPHSIIGYLNSPDLTRRDDWYCYMASNLYAGNSITTPEVNGVFFVALDTEPWRGVENPEEKWPYLHRHLLYRFFKAGGYARGEEDKARLDLIRELDINLVERANDAVIPETVRDRLVLLGQDAENSLYRVVPAPETPSRKSFHQ